MAQDSPSGGDGIRGISSGGGRFEGILAAPGFPGGSVFGSILITAVGRLTALERVAW